ncbi:MAG TPA: lysophospholipid acyltransferase family protein [Solirubrobacterales bacterium]|jgi:1-acyl-sn-glycerol-3-phosphate acyltransferase
MAEIKPQVYRDPRPAEYFDEFHQAARDGSTWVYTLARIVCTLPTILLYRLKVIGRENVPRKGAVILAPNHFSQMDHFFAGVYLPRTIRFMGKSQLFGPPILTAIFKHGGVFPVRRGHRDEEAMKTTFILLEQGEMVLIYAEGGRSRSGELGEPKRGIGRIALESGAPVVPVAIYGSAGVRGWKRLRFPQVMIEFGKPRAFQVEEDVSPERQLEVATEIFDEVKALYAGLVTRSGARSGSRTPDRARA